MDKANRVLPMRRLRSRPRQVNRGAGLGCLRAAGRRLSRREHRLNGLGERCPFGGRLSGRGRGGDGDWGLGSRSLGVFAGETATVRLAAVLGLLQCGHQLERGSTPEPGVMPEAGQGEGDQAPPVGAVGRAGVGDLPERLSSMKNRTCNLISGWSASPSLTTSYEPSRSGTTPAAHSPSRAHAAPPSSAAACLPCPSGSTGTPSGPPRRAARLRPGWTYGGGPAAAGGRRVQRDAAADSVWPRGIAMPDGTPPSPEYNKNFPHRSQRCVQVKGHDRLPCVTVKR